jgi:2-hydroxychromene-2-carboxylate isomerase
MSSGATRRTVHFWFDPGCPYTWATSRWLREAAAAHDAYVDWQLMSLAVLNEGRPVPEQFREAMARSWRPVRTLVAAGQTVGTSAVGDLYTALGQQVHEHQRPADDDVLTSALKEAGLPDSLIAAADDPSYDEGVRASHAEGQRRVGMESGSPISALDDGLAFFGPVVARIPTGQAASDLWDTFVAASKVPELSELKRGRAPL